MIAIENARLLNELREILGAPNGDLGSSARSSVRSPGELEPVFQTMLANATRICEAAFGSMLLAEGDTLRRVALHNAPPKYAEFHTSDAGRSTAKNSFARNDSSKRSRSFNIADMAIEHSE